MENRRLLNRWTSSAVKGSVCGGAVGTLVTLVLLGINFHSDPHEYVPAVALGLFSIPSIPLLKIANHFGANVSQPHSQTGLVVLVLSNGLSYAILGILIGTVIAFVRSPKKRNI
jgi:hypothetical protein